MSRVPAGPRNLRAATRPLPADIQEQYEQMVARASAGGYPLTPVPVPHLASSPRDGSRAEYRPVPRVRLDQDLVDVAAVDRAHVLAHELAHHLHRQYGVRAAGVRPLAAGAVLLFVAAAGTLVVTLVLSTLAGRPDSEVLLRLSIVCVTVAVLMAMAASRRREAATDATAVLVFGEALTEEGVRRLQRKEPRTLPLLRTHPTPARRRQAGLALLRHITTESAGVSR